MERKEIESNISIYHLELDCLSSNRAYITRNYKGGSYRYIDPEYKSWKKAVGTMMKYQDIDRKIFTSDSLFLSISIVFCIKRYDFYTLSEDDLQRIDASDMIKITEDAVVDYLDIDDKYNVDVHAFKRPSSYEHIWIIMSDRIFHPIDDINGLVDKLILI